MVTTRSFAALGALLALGLAVFGFQIGAAVKKGREFDRYFTVRGLSEREVKATLVIWPVKYNVSADDLPMLRTEMDNAKKVVLQFLEENNVALDECSFGLPRIQDHAGEYGRREDDKIKLPRYSASMTLVVRSQQVDLVKKAVQKSEELVSKGLPLTTEEYGRSIEFSFDGINTIKPAMIEEATANARAAAEKFAQDSKAKVGRIRKATQGVVEIEDRDMASPELKVIRVVTTIEFFIE
ncbi:MAG: SIMPL domain-containing protein [Nibricoccus sp.]